jgi:hypothetical protein
VRRLFPPRRNIIRYLHTLTLFTLLTFSPFSHANPLAWVGWVAAEQAVESVVDTTVNRLMAPDVSDKEVEALKQRVAELEQQMPQSPPADAPSAKAFKALQTQVDTLAAMYNKKLDSFEARLKAIEQHGGELHATAQEIAAAAEPQQAEGKLAVKLSYLYRPGGRGDFKPFHDGDTLRSGDHVKIIFSTGEPLYVYLFNRDTTGKIQRLFPLDKFGKTKLNHRNPVNAGTMQFVPAEHFSLVLDRSVGTETLYFMASRHRDTVLESFYQGLENLNDTHPSLREAVQMQQTFIQDVIAETKGYEPELAQETERVSWQEKGEDVEAQLARVKNFCDGCVQVVSYGHD